MLNEDGFYSKSKMGPGFVGLSFADLWEAISEDRIPGDVTFVKTLAEAKGQAVMEFDRSKIVVESVSLQPALVSIHTSKRGLDNFLCEREMDALFLDEAASRQQVEQMAWFLRTSPMMKFR